MVLKPNNIKTTGGVPQGLVLGPILWNVVYYNKVLEHQILQHQKKDTGFADNISIIPTEPTNADAAIA